MPSEAEQRYLDARVEGAKTVGEAYSHYAANPEAFVAGAQYALDKILSPRNADLLVVYGLRDWLNSVAVDILERAKQGEPQ